MAMGLRPKLTLAYALLAVVCTFALGAGGLLLQWQTYRDHVAERLTTNVRLVADVVISAMTSGQDLAPVAERLADLTGARVTIVDAAGRLLTDTAAGTSDSVARRPELLAALAGNASTAVTTGVGLGTSTAFAAGPLYQDGAIIGAVRLAVPLADVEGHLWRTSLLVASLTVAGAALTAGLTLLVTRALTNPLRELTTLVRQAASGQFIDRLPVRSDDELGQLAHSYNQMADQLDRMLTTSARQQAELEAILAGIQDGIIIVDAGQRVRLANQAAATFFAAAATQTIGRPLIEVARDHELVDLVGRCLHEEVTTRAIVERGPRPMSLSVTATPIAAGGLSGALVTLHDVSELRRLELGRRQFVANISHELRTPLTTMKLMIETLQQDPSDISLVDDFLGRINAEIDSLTQLVRELLELSQLESGQAPLRIDTVRMGEVAAQAVDRLRPQAERGGLTLLVDPSLAVLPPVRGDAERLEGVLVNLVHNAIKFTPPGGTIVVGGDVDTGWATLWVRDTGVGIAARDLPRLFERFYKADKSRAGGGTGLGLAIVKHTVQAHGGRVWADSTLGQGSRFSFTVPLDVPAAVPVEPLPR